MNETVVAVVGNYVVVEGEVNVVVVGLIHEQYAVGYDEKVECRELKNTD